MEGYIITDLCRRLRRSIQPYHWVLPATSGKPCVSNKGKVGVAASVRKETQLTAAAYVATTDVTSALVVELSPSTRRLSSISRCSGLGSWMFKSCVSYVLDVYTFY